MIPTTLSVIFKILQFKKKLSVQIFFLTFTDPLSVHGHCYVEQIVDHQYVGEERKLFFEVIWIAQCVLMPMTVIADYNWKLVQPSIDSLAQTDHANYNILNDRYTAASKQPQMMQIKRR